MTAKVSQAGVVALGSVDKTRARVSQAGIVMLGEQIIHVPRPFKSTGSTVLFGNLEKVVSPEAGLFKIQINSDYVSNDMTNVPVYIDLSRMPNRFWTKANSDGSNVIPIVSTVPVPIDIINFDKPNRKGQCFVLVPKIQSKRNTKITFSVKQDIINLNDNREAVWKDYYAVIMNEGGSFNRVNGDEAVPVGDEMLGGLPTIEGWLVRRNGGHLRYPAPVGTTWTGGYLGNARRRASHESILGASYDTTSDTPRATLFKRSNTTLNLWDSSKTWGATGYAYDNEKLGRDVFCHFWYDGTSIRGLSVDGDEVFAEAITVAKPSQAAARSVYVFGPNQNATELSYASAKFIYMRKGVISVAQRNFEYNMFYKDDLLLIPDGKETLRWKHAFGVHPDTESSGWGGLTVRQSIAAAVFGGAASHVRIGFESSTTSGLKVSKVVIAKKGDGDYDFASEPVELLFDGESGFSIEAVDFVLSDVLEFEIDGTSDYIVSYYVENETGYTGLYVQKETLGGTMQRAYKSTSGVLDESLIASGYTTNQGSSPTTVPSVIVGNVVTVTEPESDPDFSSSVTFDDLEFPYGFEWRYDFFRIVDMEDVEGGTAKALKFPSVATNSQKEFKFFLEVPEGGDNLVVRYKVSSEPSYDYFAILVNDVEVYRDSGNPGYKEQSIALDAGDAELTFLYKKDVSNNINDDTVYISSLKTTNPIIPIGDIISTATITFEDDTISNFIELDKSGYTIVTQADSAAGLTKALKFRSTTNSEESFFDIFTMWSEYSGKLRVRFKTSTEAGYDKFNVYVDGVNYYSYSGIASDYVELVAQVLPGAHVLRFSYSKDVSGSAGDNTVYVSLIEFTRSEEVEFASINQLNVYTVVKES